MKTSKLERKFYDTFEIPVDYPLQLTNLKYLQVIKRKRGKFLF